MIIDQRLKQELRRMYDELRLKGGIIEVNAPYRLSDQEIRDMKQYFPMLKDGELILKVDQTLLAGIVIKYGSKMIDLSLKSELTNLKQLMYESL